MTWTTSPTTACGDVDTACGLWIFTGNLFSQPWDGLVLGRPPLTGKVLSPLLKDWTLLGHLFSTICFLKVVNIESLIGLQAPLFKTYIYLDTSVSWTYFFDLLSILFPDSLTI